MGISVNDLSLRELAFLARHPGAHFYTSKDYVCGHCGRDLKHNGKYGAGLSDWLKGETLICFHGNERGEIFIGGNHAGTRTDFNLVTHGRRKH